MAKLIVTNPATGQSAEIDVITPALWPDGYTSTPELSMTALSFLLNSATKEVTIDPKKLTASITYSWPVVPAPTSPPPATAPSTPAS